MVTISQATFSLMNSLLFHSNFHEVVPQVPIYKSALAQVMAWRQTILTQFIDVYMGNLGRWIISLTPEIWQRFLKVSSPNACYGQFSWALLFEIALKWMPQNAVNVSIGSGTGMMSPAITGRIYCKISNISRTLVGDKIVNNSDVVEAMPVGAAPTTSSFLTQHLASMDWAKTAARRDETHLRFGI